MPKFVSAQSLFLRQRCSDTTYAPNNTYQSNLEAVLNSLSTDTRITYGFYNMTAGHEPDKSDYTASGALLVLPNCFVQYDNNSFYGDVPNDPLPTSSLNISPSNNATTSEDEIEDIKSLQFSLGAMKQATQNFSEEYKLGEGGFGSVYKGYISPEYALERQVSVKSDVYSFGVLVLEIVSGQRITSFFYDEDNQENLFKLYDPADRPTMSAVDLMLSSDSVTLQVPAQPAFCTKGQNLPDMLLECSTTTKSSVRSEGGSINNVSITELHPR
uniref:Serine-threonine/tyrosine-protein kinase catalytic domain-containing protein n=1 Tax=Chenopodium quinoa TaxID=63459 RepID=A0A803N2K4_CHEQI